MNKVLTMTASCLLLAGSAFGASFVNGGFETGDFTGWTQGSGVWNTPYSLPAPSSYLPSGGNYNASYDASAIVSAGIDPNSNGNLSMVYSGNYSVRVNDSNNNYSASVISQTVTNYTDAAIYFAWAAVLQGSHGAGDSDGFSLQLTDDTANEVLYSVSYDSATAPSGLFNDNGFGWYYTDWQIQSLDVSARSGNTFTLTLLGVDCPYGGHAGYVYLDGFGAEAPPEGPEAPEPASMLLMATGAGAIFLARRRKKNA